MTPIGPGEMRARSRLGVVLVVAAVRLLGGFCLALPLSAPLAASGVGQTAQGDRALFEGGGYLLLEVLRLQGGDLIATARGLIPLLALGLALTVVCNAALLVALNARGRLVLGTWLGRAFSRVPAFVVVGCGVGLAQLLLVTVGVSVSEALPTPIDKPVLASTAQLALWLVVASLAGAVGGFSDVVKAALVRHDCPLAAGLRQASVCVRLRPLAACFGWLPFAVLFALSFGLGTWLTEALDVSRPGMWRVAAVFAIHQLVVVFSVFLRAAWFARALRLSASPARSSSGQKVVPKFSQVAG